MGTKRTVYVHGYYGYSNCGDEAFKIFFNDTLGAFDIIFTSPKNPPPAYKERSFLIIGGGNVIDSFFLDCVDKSWTGKLMAAGVGLSSMAGLESLAGLAPVACMVRNSSEISVFQQYINNSCTIPDLVLGINTQSLFEGQESTLNDLSNGSLKKAVVVLSDRLTSFLGQATEQDTCLSAFSMASISRITEYLQFLSNYYEIHFVAFTNNFYHRDDCINGLIGSNLTGRHNTVSYYICGDNPAQGIRLVDAADLVISSKFHSSIFSLLCGKPFINISDAPKCTSLMRDINALSLNLPFISKVPSMDELLQATKIAESTPRPVYNAYVKRSKATIERVKLEIVKHAKAICGDHD